MTTTTSNPKIPKIRDIAKREGKSPETIWRWLTVGCIGRDGERHHLRHIKRGRDIHVRPEWVEDFFAALTQRADSGGAA